MPKLTDTEKLEKALRIADGSLYRSDTDAWALGILAAVVRGELDKPETKLEALAHTAERVMGVKVFNEPVGVPAVETYWKKDELILISSGEYSDYQIHEVAKASKDFALEAVIEAYLAEHPEQRESYSVQYTQFITFLLLKGFVELVPNQELHLGAYGFFELEGAR